MGNHRGLCHQLHPQRTRIDPRIRIHKQRQLIGHVGHTLRVVGRESIGITGIRSYIGITIDRPVDDGGLAVVTGNGRVRIITHQRHLYLLGRVQRHVGTGEGGQRIHLVTHIDPRLVQVIVRNQLVNVTGIGHDTSVVQERIDRVVAVVIGRHIHIITVQLEVIVPPLILILNRVGGDHHVRQGHVQRRQGIGDQRGGGSRHPDRVQGRERVDIRDVGTDLRRIHVGRYIGRKVAAQNPVIGPGAAVHALNLQGGIISRKQQFHLRRRGLSSHGIRRHVGRRHHIERTVGRFNRYGGRIGRQNHKRVLRIRRQPRKIKIGILFSAAGGHRAVRGAGHCGTDQIIGPHRFEIPRRHEGYTVRGRGIALHGGLGQCIHPRLYGNRVARNVFNVVSGQTVSIERIGGQIERIHVGRRCACTGHQYIRIAHHGHKIVNTRENDLDRRGSDRADGRRGQIGHRIRRNNVGHVNGRQHLVIQIRLNDVIVFGRWEHVGRVGRIHGRK